ncbi:Thiamin/hydroxymethyl pyrimidine-binding protein-like, putative [Phaffia rhodozyma]|uniref:Thiamin/hydroxymethyl pyrimidine-binding protein-like, putative n=1 Tax=Phaffia rhodozyma TaxID=264483 RepID=A0A0F7SKI2_PHARH|nr:Thiamin/hydroxymethyl pyrimidine-binding protein-like, putative [Phaffia rhodozyma]
MSSTQEDQSAPTELYAVAVCLIPMGLDTPSVGPQIAECQRILKKSGLTYQIGGYGTNVEGPWSQVMAVIGECHQAVHKMGTPRIATDIRIGTRTDKQIAPGQGNLGKVARVKEILEKDP